MSVTMKSYLLIRLILHCAFGSVSSFKSSFLICSSSYGVRRSRHVKVASVHSKLRSLLSSTLSDDESIPAIYPLSRKKVMLIEEAKKLDPSFVASGKGSYSPIGWSNRLGSVLTPASIPGVYTADRPFYWNKIDVGCRMTVIQLNSKDSRDQPELVVHSPVGLDPPLMHALEQLGTVAHVISPNYEHVKYASQWAKQYPSAKMWGCPGLMKKEPEVQWTGEIRWGARPPGFARYFGAETYDTMASETGTDDMWNWEDLQPLHVNTEVNPFTGKAFFNEVIFYHPSSKTILMTDLYWNYPRGDGVTNGQISDQLIGDESREYLDREESDFGVWELAPDVGEIPIGSRAWKVGMDKLFRPFYMNFMVKGEQRHVFEQIAQYITCGNGSSGWEVETIIPAHGDIVRGKELCRNILEWHFNIRCCNSISKNGRFDSHYTSPSVLDWLQKMALSYNLEKGDDLLHVLQRHGSERSDKFNSDCSNVRSDNHLLHLADICAQTSIPIASHDFLRNPSGEAIYNYGNKAFLHAFGYDWEEFVQLPSRKCVETKEEEDERQKILDAVKKNAIKPGGSDATENSSGYDNLVRVRKDGRKILLKGVNLWNVYDLNSVNFQSARQAIEKGEIKVIGQAVWIDTIEYLD